jgi:hypothetical protein
MNDGVLVIFGCAVSFIALCGAYIYVRESFIYTSQAEKDAEAQARLSLATQVPALK